MELREITGDWSADANAWVSDTLTLTGDSWLEITLPTKGRLVIKKAEQAQGPFPKALITRWAGPDFRIRLYGSTEARYIQIHLTVTPSAIHLAPI